MVGPGAHLLVCLHATASALPKFNHCTNPPQLFCTNPSEPQPMRAFPGLRYPQTQPDAFHAGMRDAILFQYRMSE